MKKVVAYIVITVLILNLFSLSAFAINETDAAYEETDACSEELSDNVTLEQTTENNEIQSMASSTPYSFYAPVGGTLVLDYVGEINPWADVIYTKIVYLSNEYTLFLQRTFSSNKTEEVIDFLVDQGMGQVTEIIATGLAEILGQSNMNLLGLVGFSIEVMIFILSNLAQWDFEDAMEESTTGRVKVEFFYSVSAAPPYYMSMRNFEPWNDSYVTVPANYDYNWNSGVFAMNELSDSCQHQYGDWTYGDANNHVKMCQKCGYIVPLPHEYANELVSADVNKHGKRCTYCGYVSPTGLHRFTWTSLGASQHSGFCSVCEYTRIEKHSSSYDPIAGRCKTCGYSGPIQLNSIFSNVMTLRE